MAAQGRPGVAMNTQIQAYLDGADFDRARLLLDLERARLDERRLALDESLPKKWGPVAFGALVTLAVAAMSATVTIVQSKEAREATERQTIAQAAETARAQIAADLQREVENGRAVAELYFDRLFLLANKEPLSTIERQQIVDGLQLLTTVSANRGVSTLFTRALERVAAVNISETRTGADGDSEGLQTAPVSQAMSGLPDFAQRPEERAYQPVDFVAYPQIPDARYDALAERFGAAISGLGFRVQPAERMQLDAAPDGNEVRYYFDEHKDVARLAAAQLSLLFNEPFSAKRVNVTTPLPNGVMEFWLGQEVASQPAPPPPAPKPD